MSIRLLQHEVFGHLNFFDTAAFVIPSAHANKIRPQNINVCDVFFRRAQRFCVSLSTSDKESSDNFLFAIVPSLI